MRVWCVHTTAFDHPERAPQCSSSLDLDRLGRLTLPNASRSALPMSVTVFRPASTALAVAAPLLPVPVPFLASRMRRRREDVLRAVEELLGPVRDGLVHGDAVCVARREGLSVHRKARHVSKRGQHSRGLVHRHNVLLQVDLSVQPRVPDELDDPALALFGRQAEPGRQVAGDCDASV